MEGAAAPRSGGLISPAAPVQVRPSHAGESRPSGLASPSLTILLVTSELDDRSMISLVQDAAPGEDVVVCGSAPEALAAAAQGQTYGRHAGVFVFDHRRRSTSDLAADVKRVDRVHPTAEIIVILDPSQSAGFAACVQVVASPDRLTFLLSPVDGRHAAETLRTVIERRRLAVVTAARTRREDSIQQELQLKITELSARLDIAKHAARHDGLTGVLNRTGFVEELSARLARGRQDQTVVMFDLDRFKSVNDTLGHSGGDDLVRKISTGVQGILPAGAVLARLGGDEFGVLVEGASSSGVEQMSEAIRKVCCQARHILGHEVQVSASIGIAFRRSGAATEMELMRQADLALYAAKREGKNRWRHFDVALDTATKYRLSIENGLERALRSGQLRMAYQPIVDAVTAETKGFEALVRWESPEHGTVSPAEFIPIAEETGLILDVGDWITRQALRDCRKWGAPYVSINLSSRQFLRHNVGERILRYAADADVSPTKIQIELTETAIIDDVERADYNLKKMRAAGVRVALDDFGTGYSSLTYLKQFAIDCIKIDKSFVDNITRDRQSAVIVASVCRLATSLGMSVVAEGVENEDQRRILLAAGCGALQGYHFGRPVPISKLVSAHPD